MRIFLVRHGKSEANIDANVHRDTPDCLVPLANEGKLQAMEAGKFLYAYFSQPELKDQKARLWNSGYKRTRQTTQGILKYANPVISEVREDNRLREQSMGIWDGLTDEEKQEQNPVEYHHYKKHAGDAFYFAPIPGGETRAQVEERIETFFGTLKRDEEKGIENVVLVTHGNTIKSFVKRWMHHDFEWGSNEPTPGNCSIRLIEGDSKNGYVDRGYIYTGKKEEVDALLKKAGVSLPSIPLSNGG